MHRQRARDGNALTLTAGELVRVAEQHILLQSALLHGAHHVLAHLGGAVPEELMRDQPLLDDLPDGEPGVEAGVRILEDDLQILAQDAHLAVLQAGKVNAVVQHRLVALKLHVIPVHLLNCGNGLLRFPDLRVQPVPLAGQPVAPALQPGKLRRICRLAVVRRAALRLIQHQLDVADAVAQCGGALLQPCLAVQQSRALLGVPHQEAAEDLGDVRLRGLVLRDRQILVLQVEEGRRLPQLTDLGGCRVRACLRGVQPGDIALGVPERVGHVPGRQLGAGHSVVHGGACRLLVELEQNSAQRGFSAAGLADNAERFALVDVQGNILIRLHVVLLALKDAGLRNGEVFFKIRDR